MKENFDFIIEKVLEAEGGFVQRSKKADPGGATKYGITFDVLRAWRRKNITVDDVKKLTKEEAKEIYRFQYWNIVKGDDLPDIFDYLVLDFSLHSGPRVAVSYLQRMIGSEQDGIMGVKTLYSLKQFIDLKGSEYVQELYLNLRLGFLKKLRNWKYNDTGWTNRIDALRRYKGNPQK